MFGSERWISRGEPGDGSLRGHIPVIPRAGGARSLLMLPPAPERKELPKLVKEGSRLEEERSLISLIPKIWRVSRREEREI